MGREIQKRKRRSSRPAVRQPSSSKSKRLMFPLGNSIVAQNWDKKQTASQNYKRLGLVNRLKAPTGGVEPDRKALASTSSSTTTGSSSSPLTILKSKKSSASSSSSASDPFAIQPATSSVVSEVRVERDENGKIIRILDGSSSSGSRPKPNPLNDPLNALDSDEEDEGQDNDDGEEWGGIEEQEGQEGNIIRQLEEEANRPQVKIPRGQSQREREWLEALVARHGDDLAAMARDRRLNPMQQTAADIGRRIKKWRKQE